jgi:hypothetical protein
VCSKQQSFKIGKANSDGAEMRNRQAIVIVEDFNIPLSTMDRTIRLKISKDAQPANSFL